MDGGLRVGQHQGVLPRQFDQKGGHLPGGRVVRGGHIQLHPAGGLGGEVGDVGGDDGAVGQLDQLVVRGSDLGIEHADLLHGARAHPHVHKVPHREGVGGQQLHPTRHVGQEVLQRQGEGQPHHRQHRHQGGDLNAQAAQHDDGGHRPQRALHQIAQKGLEGRVQLGAAQSPFQHLGEHFDEDQADYDG